MVYLGDAAIQSQIDAATSPASDSRLSLLGIMAQPAAGAAEQSLVEPAVVPEAASEAAPASKARPSETTANACNSFNSSDRFGLNVRFENNDSVAPANRGVCVDTSQKRPIHILSNKEIQDLHLPPAAPGETLIANFSYNNKFYIARFPADAVSNILAEKELFNPGIPVGDQLNMLLGFSAHFQQRFEFNKPGKEVVLLPQDDPTDTSKAIRIHNVVASDEAVSREGGEPFDLLKGLEGHYAFVRTMTGLQDRYDDMIVKQHHQVYQWQIKPVINKDNLIDGKVPTPDLVRQEYLKSALDLSDKDYQSFKQGHPLMYNTLQRSCVTGGFEIYDRVDHYRNPIQPELEHLKRNPMFIKQMLFSRGLISLQDTLPLLNKTPDLGTEVQSSPSFKW